MAPKSAVTRGRGRRTRRNLEPSRGSAAQEQHSPVREQSPPILTTAIPRGSGADFARDFLHTLQGYIQQQTMPQHKPEPHQATPRTNEVVEQFRRFSPPKFHGKEGPEAAEEWIEEMERIFGHLECTESQKVSCARFQLVEDAGHWWKSQERILTEEQKQNLTWER